MYSRLACRARVSASTFATASRLVYPFCSRLACLVFAGYFLNSTAKLQQKFYICKSFIKKILFFLFTSCNYL